MGISRFGLERLGETLETFSLSPHEWKLKGSMRQDNYKGEIEKTPEAPLDLQRRHGASHEIQPIAAGRTGFSDYGRLRRGECRCDQRAMAGRLSQRRRPTSMVVEDGDAAENTAPSTTCLISTNNLLDLLNSYSIVDP